MGPFGTVVMVPMVPELRDSFSATSGQVALGYSLYLFPFAGLLLVSGTLGERWGRRRTVRTTYVLYAVASIVCAVAPTLGWFVTGRALQGVANAFITPLLIAGLAEMVPEHRFGREVGVYSSFQAIGGGLGPIVGGIAADTDWRWAFVGTAVISLLLALVPPQGEPREASAALSLRPLLTPRMLLLGMAFFFAAAGPLGVGVIVGVAARDVLSLSGGAAGLMLFVGSLAAMALGPFSGRLVDRLGAMRTGAVACAGAVLLTAVLAMADSAFVLGVLWAVTAAVIALVVIVYQATGPTIIPSNRGGALSFLLAFRFVGHGVGPLLFVPLIGAHTAWAFIGASALGLVTLAVFAWEAIQSQTSSS